jgi:PAS domain S-box-containing protein
MSIPTDEYDFTEAVAEIKGFSIFMLDTDGIIKTWNSGCELMKGYKAEEAIGQNFDILFPEFLKEQKLHEKERDQARTNGRCEIENWRKRKNGELFWAYVVLTPVYDESGNHVGFIKITQDQTEKKKYLDQLTLSNEEINKTNEKLDHINNELLKSNAVLEEFAYASSHDLQAPLRKISVYAGQLKNELWHLLNDEQKESFNRINKSTSRMFTLIKDLLSYSTISGNEEELQEIDLNKVVTDVLEQLEIEIFENKAVFKIDRLPVIRGNEQKFQQVFQNLISNAIKYNQAGEIPMISISSCRITGDELTGLPFQAPGIWFHLIQIKDNGIGFEQTFAEDIFKVFTRLNTGSNYIGSGVGLSIVKKVIDNHQGHIWAESKPGEGATFNILLPHDTY